MGAIADLLPSWYRGRVPHLDPTCGPEGDPKIVIVKAGRSSNGGWSPMKERKGLPQPMPPASTPWKSIGHTARSARRYTWPCKGSSRIYTEVLDPGAPGGIARRTAGSKRTPTATVNYRPWEERQHDIHHQGRQPGSASPTSSAKRPSPSRSPPREPVGCMCRRLPPVSSPF